MKASIYQTADDVYLAVLTDGLQLMRGSLEDLAAALHAKNVAAEDLLFGDWREDTQLLDQPAQGQLAELILLAPLSEL